MPKNYVAQNLAKLSMTMHGNADTLEGGISAYNNKQYDSALRLFRSYYNNHPESGYTKEYIGITYLVTNSYDSALHQFDELSHMQALHNTPGLFLKAVTLLRRNKEGDKVHARQLQQQVVERKLEGNKVAEKWLKKF